MYPTEYKSRKIIGNKYKFSASEEVASVRKKGAFFYLI